MSVMYSNSENNIEVADDNKIIISCSSEALISSSHKWDDYSYEFGRILKHDAQNIDLVRFNNKANVLFNHDKDFTIGVIERCWLDNKKLYSEIRISKSDKAQEVYQQIKEGILNKTSIGCHINESQVERLESQNSYREIETITKWTPFEVSIVTVPADDSVGIEQRALDTFNHFQSSKTKDINMPNQIEKQSQEKPTNENTVAQQAEPMTVTPIDSYQETRELILKKGQEFGQTDLAIEYALEQRSYQDFADAIMTRKFKPTNINDANTSIDLTPKEKSQYCIARGLQAKLAGNKNLAPFEMEVSDTLARTWGGTGEGLYVPQEVLTRSHDTVSNAELIKTHQGGIIEMMQAQSVVLQHATKMTNLKGKLKFPRETANVKAYWVAEKKAAAKSKKEFKKFLELEAKTLSANVVQTKELLAQESYNIEALIRKDIAKQFSLTVDHTALYGAGTADEPGGLFNDAEVQKIDYTSLDYAQLVALRRMIAENNFNSSLKYLFDPETEAELEVTARGNGVQNNILSAIKNYSSSTQINSGDIILGDFSEIIFGQWQGGMELIVDPYTLAETRQVKIVANMMLDIGIKNPNAFAIAKKKVTP